MALAWIALIALFSGEGFSADATLQTLSSLLRWLFGERAPEFAYAVGFTLRKGAHVVEYAVLALLAHRALRLTFDTAPGRTLAGALLLALVVAVADESRQAQSTLRTGSVGDVGIDLAAAATALVAVTAWRRTARPSPAAGPSA